MSIRLNKDDERRNDGVQGRTVAEVSVPEPFLERMETWENEPVQREAGGAGAGVSSIWRNLAKEYIYF